MYEGDICFIYVCVYLFSLLACEYIFFLMVVVVYISFLYSPVCIFVFLMFVVMHNCFLYASVLTGFLNFCVCRTVVAFINCNLAIL